MDFGAGHLMCKKQILLICTESAQVHRHNWFKCADVRIYIILSAQTATTMHTATAINFHNAESDINNYQALLQTKFLQAITCALTAATNWASLN